MTVSCLMPYAYYYRNNGECPATRIQGHVRATQIENVAEKIMRLADDDTAVAADIILIIYTQLPSRIIVDLSSALPTMYDTI